MIAGMLLIIQVYAGLGAGVALVFLVWGIDRLDDSARGAVAFRPLLIPGVVILWPMVLLRWRALAGYDEARRFRPPRRAQGALALVLGLAIPVAVFGGLIVRQDGPHEAPAVLLAPPDATSGAAEPKAGQ